MSFYGKITTVRCRIEIRDCSCLLNSLILRPVPYGNRFCAAQRFNQLILDITRSGFEFEFEFEFEVYYPKQKVHQYITIKCE